LSPSRIDRSRIYGSRKRVALDSQGRPCTRAALTLDGQHLLGTGMLAQGHFTPDGRWVERKEMVGLSADGSVVTPAPSTLGMDQTAEGPVDPSEVLKLEMQSIYWLEPDEGCTPLVERLRAGDVFRFRFNYTASLVPGTAYLLANDEGVFALVGQSVEDRWLEMAQEFVPTEGDNSDDDDLDFEDF